MEQWVQIQDYPSYYVSNYGRIKSYKHDKKVGKIINGTINSKGYCMIGLYKDNKEILKPVHRLVAEAFIPKIIDKDLINHKDGNKTNNKVENLEWVNNSENIYHAYHELGFNPNGIKIFQIDISSNNIINTFISAEEASRTTGIDASSIRKVCNNKRKTAGKYKWRNAYEY